MHLLVFALFLQLFFYGVMSAWMTEYNKQFTFTCPDGQSLNKLESSHENKFEDRVWNFSCGTLGEDTEMGPCEWSGYANEFDEPLDFQCQSDAIVTGISSYYDEHFRKDRRFKFMCCGVKDLAPHLCEYTPYVNDYDGILSYRVRDNWFLRGVSSVHDNYREDRIFRFNICKLGHVEDDIVVGK